MATHCPVARRSPCTDKIVCRCLQVSESHLVEAITTLGLRTVRDVKHVTGAGDGCTCCHRHIKQYLEAADSPD